MNFVMLVTDKFMNCLFFGIGLGIELKLFEIVEKNMHV